MKKYLAILGAAILMLATLATAATTGFDSVAISCSAVATTGACATYNVSPADFVHIPSVQSFTWQTIIAGGTATTVSVALQGSVDGTTWTTLDTSTSISGETRTKTPAAVLFFRCNVGTYSTNGTTLTCQIMPTRATSSGGGGGTWGSITGTLSDQSDLQASLNLLTPLSVAINSQANNWTLALTDAGKYIRMTSSSANTVTVPLNASVAFALGTSVTVRQAGTGITTIVATGGVTINTPSSLVLRVQNSSVQMLKVATDTWDLMGDTQ